MFTEVHVTDPAVDVITLVHPVAVYKNSMQILRSLFSKWELVTGWGGSLIPGSTKTKRLPKLAIQNQPS
jgi:hypothetical protein